MNTDEVLEKIIQGMYDFEAKTGNPVKWIVLNKYYNFTKIRGVEVTTSIWSPWDCLFFDKEAKEVLKTLTK